MEPKPGRHKPAQPPVTVDLGTEALTAEGVCEDGPVVELQPIKKTTMDFTG